MTYTSSQTLVRGLARLVSVLFLVFVGTSSFALSASALTLADARQFVQAKAVVLRDSASQALNKNDEIKEESASIATSTKETVKPEAAKIVEKPVKVIKIDMTAYTSSVEECDSDPFIAADGTTTYFGMIATNAYPFGTRVRIPELFGDKVFVVHDRMNARYTNRIDVWLEKKTDMRQFGIKHNVRVEIVEMGDNKTQWAKIAEQNRLAREAKKAAALAKAKQTVELTAKVTK